MYFAKSKFSPIEVYDSSHPNQRMDLGCEQIWSLDKTPYFHGSPFETLRYLITWSYIFLFFICLFLLILLVLLLESSMFSFCKGFLGKEI